MKLYKSLLVMLLFLLTTLAFPWGSELCQGCRIDSSALAGPIYTFPNSQLFQQMISTNGTFLFQDAIDRLPAYSTGVKLEIRTQSKSPLRLAYDVNNYVDFSVGTNGGLTINATGGVVISSNGNVIIKNGNVGIGTLSPDAKLCVQSLISIKNSSGLTTGYAGLGVMGDAPTNSLNIRSDAGGIAFGISGFTKTVIDTNGNVGIGTTNPLAKLDIGGTDAVKLPVGTTAQRSITPTTGMIRVNSTLNRLEYWDGYNWIGAYEQSSYIIATGGTITTVGNYKVHTFTSNGTFTVSNIIGAGIVEYLIVGGGGSGGAYWGGGGGAGGVLSGSTTVTATIYSVIIGAGGSAKTESLTAPQNGGNSTALGFIAIGGGGGAPGQADATFAKSGGSGGGGGGFNGSSYAGQGTNSQGTNGGQGYYYGAITFQMGGGGGGASSPGNNAATGSGPVGGGGYGGDGLISAISGSPITYGGGGGGGTGYSTAGGSGGAGGGGAGGHSAQQGQNGTANKGGGGGGGGINNNTYYYSGAGGSGVVIIRYRFQ